MIRRCTLEDREFILAVAEDRYDTFHRDKASAWIEQMTTISADQALMLRGESGFLIAIAHRIFHSQKLEVHLVFWATRPNRSFEGFHMLEMMIDWARDMGASVNFGEQTGIDLRSVAKRLGAKPTRSWRIEA